MRFDESPGALPADSTGAAATATGSWYTLTLDAGVYQADAVAAEAPVARDAAGSAVIGLSITGEAVRHTVTF